MINAVSEPLSQFIDWVLLDLAYREPSGKNPVTLMEGILRAYQPSSRGKGSGRRAYKLRGSDLTLRRYISILALREEKFTLDFSFMEVASRLGQSTAAAAESVSRGYYEFVPPFPPEGMLADWQGLFKAWKLWVLQADERTIDCVAKLFEDRLVPERAKKFRDLVGRIRGVHKTGYLGFRPS
jgi:hypothetical protein